MGVPLEYQDTLDKLVAADREVAQATCDIPHLTPMAYLNSSPRAEEDDLPYCGWFVGVYAWMQECKARSDKDPTVGYPPDIISNRTGIDVWETRNFAMWCCTALRDRAAVEYVREKLSEEN